MPTCKSLKPLCVYVKPLNLENALLSPSFISFHEHLPYSDEWYMNYTAAKSLYTKQCLCLGL